MSLFVSVTNHIMSLDFFGVLRLQTLQSGLVTSLAQHPLPCDQTTTCLRKSKTSSIDDFSFLESESIHGFHQDVLVLQVIKRKYRLSTLLGDTAQEAPATC